MTSVDELFKQSNGGLKRKLEDPTTSFSRSHPSKSTKFNNGESPHTSGQHGSSNGSKAAFVQEEEPDDDDVEAGPAPPPEDDEEEADEPDEDEEGRFFGGGVTKEERSVLDYIERNEDGEVEEKIDLTWLKKTAVSFERKINKNAELRAKYEDEPLKFVASEADLDTEIKNLSLLGEHPELYQDLVRSGCADSLVGLLAHENTDIAISACEVISELTDEDTGAGEAEWNALVKSMLKADLADLLVSNLRRLDENNENDRAGVYHVLSIMENLLSATQNADTLGANTKLLEWLLGRIRKPDEDVRRKVGQNRQYAAEILAILAQSSASNQNRLAKLKAVDSLLQLLSTWRRRNPEENSDEEEFAENLFDCLVSLVKEGHAAESFVQDEGVELCLIMLKEGEFSKAGALRVLDHATGVSSAVAVAEKVVEAGGLKPLFTSFMKSKKMERDSVEHILGILANMLKLLPADTPARIRLLAKFMEKDYEKIVRLVELRKDYGTRVRSVEKEIAAESRDLSDEDKLDMEAEWLSRRMDGGLFSLQTLDLILAWLVAEDVGARKKITGLIEGGDDGLLAIRKSLKEQMQGMDADESEDIASSREMLAALIECLQ